MPRCTAEEWKLDYIECAYRGCQIDVSVAFTACRRELVDLNLAKKIGLAAALDGIAQCSALELEAYKACALRFGKDVADEEAPKRFSEDQRATFGHASNALWRGAALAGFGATAAGLIVGAPARGVVFALGLIAGIYGFAATAMSDLSIDPPDPDFTKISQPNRLDVPVMEITEELSEAVSEPLNAMFANLAEAVGLARAVVIAINKAGTAELAGNIDARDLQLAAAKEFALRWSDLLEKAAPLRWTAAQQIANTTFGSQQISEEDAYKVRNELWTNGWPKSLLDFFSQQGISGDQQREIEREMRIRTGNLSNFVTTLSNIMAAQDLSPHEIEVTSTLREFATG